jgi:uncharacterized protein (TIGR02246 family)
MSNFQRFAHGCFCALLLSMSMTSTQVRAEGNALVASTTAKWVDNWNAHDAVALGKLLTQDVDFVLVNGTMLHGRQDFTRVHAEQFSGRYKNSVFQKDGEPDFSFIRPDVVVVHWRWSISGVENPDGSPAQTYHGIFTWVLVKTRGTWEIRAAQNTVGK